MVTDWTLEVDAAFAGWPLDKFKDFVKKGSSDGGTVTIERKANSIEITVKNGGSMSSRSGSWR